MKACQYVLRVNHRQYLVLINPTKLIFCPIFEGDATRRGGWRVDSGGPTGGGDRGRWPIRGCYAIKLPPILLGHPNLTLSLVLYLRQYICICPCICVFEVCSTVQGPPTNERLLRTWPPFNPPGIHEPCHASLILNEEGEMLAKKSKKCLSLLKCPFATVAQNQTFTEYLGLHHLH